MSGINRENSALVQTVPVPANDPRPAYTILRDKGDAVTTIADDIATTARTAELAARTGKLVEAVRYLHRCKRLAERVVTQLEFIPADTPEPVFPAPEPVRFLRRNQ